MVTQLGSFPTSDHLEFMGGMWVDAHGEVMADGAGMAEYITMLQVDEVRITATTKQGK